jgi:hypothetical protein
LRWMRGVMAGLPSMAVHSTSSVGVHC